MMRNVLSLALVLAAGVAAAAAANAGASEITIPERPEQLEFEPIEFEVPRADEFRHELDNGVVAYVGEDDELPLVSLSITVRAGAFLDPDGKPGVASMTGRLLRTGGTKNLDPGEFDERADFLAAQISSFGGSTRSGASLSCLSYKLDECLDLFFDMLRKPRFDQDRLDVAKTDRIESMKQRNDDPRSIASREWSWLMRGREHFTARALTQAQIEAITREDLAAFHQKYWEPKNMIVSVSGDVETAAIVEELSSRFEGWESDGPDVPWPPPAPDHEPEAGVFHVEKDIPQSRVRIGHLVDRMDWMDEGRMPALVMNDILGGGGFTSRITNRIRSDEGLAYSAGSSFSPSAYWPGSFTVFFQTKNRTVAFASKIALEELERIRSGKVSEEELEVAKASFIDTFPQNFDSTDAIVSLFASDEYNGRPHEYWYGYQDRVRQVSRADVRRAAEQHLSPDGVTMLIVGRWDDVAPGDEDGRASMAEFFDGEVEHLPLRDPLTLEPMEAAAQSD